MFHGWDSSDTTWFLCLLAFMVFAWWDKAIVRRQARVDATRDGFVAGCKTGWAMRGKAGEREAHVVKATLGGIKLPDVSLKPGDGEDAFGRISLMNGRGDA